VPDVGGGAFAAVEYAVPEPAPDFAAVSRADGAVGDDFAAVSPVVGAAPAGVTGLALKLSATSDTIAVVLPTEIFMVLSILVVS